MQPHDIETIWRYIPLIDGPFNDIWVSFFLHPLWLACNCMLELVHLIMSVVYYQLYYPPSMYRLCITHKQLQSLLTFLYMHSLDWCLLQEVWIRLIMAKGQRHTMHKNINMWCIVRWMKIRCMLFRCLCTISIVRIIGKISWYWCFIWYRCTLTFFGLNYTLLFLVSIGMLIGMVWYITSLVHLSRWRKIYWDTQQLTLPRLHIWNSGYYAVKANTEGTDLPRDMVP